MASSLKRPPDIAGSSPIKEEGQKRQRLGQSPDVKPDLGFSASTPSRVRSMEQSTDIFENYFDLTDDKDDQDIIDLTQDEVEIPLRTPGLSAVIRPGKLGYKIKGLPARGGSSVASPSAGKHAIHPLSSESPGHLPSQMNPHAYHPNISFGPVALTPLPSKRLNSLASASNVPTLDDTKPLTPDVKREVVSEEKNGINTTPGPQHMHSYVKPEHGSRTPVDPQQTRSWVQPEHGSRTPTGLQNTPNQVKPEHDSRTPAGPQLMHSWVKLEHDFKVPVDVKLAKIFKSESPSTPIKSDSAQRRASWLTDAEAERLANAATPTRSEPRDVINSTVDEKNLSRMSRAEQPKELKTKLLRHQRQALKWMIDMESPKLPNCDSPDTVQFWKHKYEGYYHVLANCTYPQEPTLFSGGILADDMGLGKTLEMISLILSTPKEGPTLVVTPMGVMSNWETQIRQHIKWNYALRLFRYHGPHCHVTPEELGRHDVVVTTYGRLGNEVGGALLKVQWRRVILDEGHTIRNPKTQTAKAACKLQARSRWVCTGTPIINKVEDVYSMAKFIGVKGGGLQHWPFFKKLMEDNHTLQLFIATLCLRRTKKMGFINLNLPEKSEEVARITFEPHEREKYQRLLQDAKKSAALYFKTHDYSLWSTILEQLLRLRQMCDHWTLCRKKVDEACRRDLKAELDQLGEHVQPADLRRVLQLSTEAKVPCGACEDPIEPQCDPVITPCKHVFCGECITVPVERNSACPECRQPLEAERLVDLGPLRADASLFPASSEHSSKTKALLSLVKERLKNPGSKIVIFSQWTSFLAVFSRYLMQEGIPFTRLDGKMKPDARDAAVKGLQKKGSLRVMLASLRVAGVGINLCAADTIILADLWWAPAIEEQAVDRIHRLGQTRWVKVYRLLIEDTVEERVLAIQDKKRELVGTALQEDFKIMMNKVDGDRMLRELLG